MSEEIVSIFIGESQLQLALTVDQVRWSLLTKVIFSSYVCEVKKISAHRLVPNVCNVIKKMWFGKYGLVLLGLHYDFNNWIFLTRFLFELINLNK